MPPIDSGPARPGDDSISFQPTIDLPQVGPQIDETNDLSLEIYRLHQHQMCVSELVCFLLGGRQSGDVCGSDAILTQVLGEGHPVGPEDSCRLDIWRTLQRGESILRSLR